MGSSGWVIRLDGGIRTPRPRSLTNLYACFTSNPAQRLQNTAHIQHHLLTRSLSFKPKGLHPGTALPELRAPAGFSLTR